MLMFFIYLVPYFYRLLLVPLEVCRQELRQHLRVYRVNEEEGNGTFLGLIDHRYLLLCLPCLRPKQHPIANEP